MADPSLTPSDPRLGSLAPTELAGWIESRLESLASRWAAEIRARGIGGGRALDEILDRFVVRLVAFLPWMLGPHRDTIEPFWIRAAELFGSVAARRGLAAGEVIEEFQILRELVIRDLYRDPPAGGRRPLSLRDVLRLNRGIDRGVTHASVAHTDALFFQFFEAEGSADHPVSDSEDLLAEITEQLELIDQELGEILEHTPDLGGEG